MIYAIGKYKNVEKKVEGGCSRSGYGKGNMGNGWWSGTLSATEGVLNFWVHKQTTRSRIAIGNSGDASL